MRPSPSGNPDKLTAIRTQRLPNLKLEVSESHLLTPVDLTFG
jgi:hypothetical protein